MPLKIQVLGKGMIPRDLGLAPRLTPFPADYDLIGSIMETPGLSVNYINPEDGRVIALTRQNMQRVWKKYGNYVASQAPVEQTQPHVPGEDDAADVTPPTVEDENNEDKHDDVDTTASEDQKTEEKPETLGDNAIEEASSKDKAGEEKPAESQNTGSNNGHLSPVFGTDTSDEKTTVTPVDPMKPVVNGQNGQQKNQGYQNNKNKNRH